MLKITSFVVVSFLVTWVFCDELNDRCVALFNQQRDQLTKDEKLRYPQVQFNPKTLNRLQRYSEMYSSTSGTDIAKVPSVRGMRNVIAYGKSCEDIVAHISNSVTKGNIVRVQDAKTLLYTTGFGCLSDSTTARVLCLFQGKDE